MHTYARLERYAADPATGLLRADPASRTVLVGAVPNEGFPVCHSSHMIGTLRFGEDGTLFAGSGDGAHFNGYDVGGRDPECFDPDGLPQFDGEEFDIGALRSIHPDSPSGKILRIDPFTGLGLPSNPYWDGNPASVRSKTWVSGLRNPFRFGLRPNTGSPDPADGLPGTLYAGDVGWSTWEEVNVGYGGENFGWPCYEGDAVQGAYRDQSNGACATLYDGTNPYGPDLDAVLTGVADELRRGVETHRLAVQQGTSEHGRMVPLQPGRDIDQPREARRMAFREAITAEAFDLGEASLREPRLVAASQHARDESLAERADRAHPLEGCERPTQPVGFGRREAGRDHRDLHGLLLEERDTIGPA